MSSGVSYQGETNRI